MSHYLNPQRRGRYNDELARSDNSDETDNTSRYSQGSNYYNDDQYYYESSNQSYISRGNRGSFNSGVASQQSYQSRGNGDSFISGVVSNQQDLRSYNSGFSDSQSVQSYGASSYQSRQGNQRSQSGNASVCESTSATTVAGGGRGRCPYQIGFNVKNSGKQMSTSKRIIHFRFGFANPQALVSGLAGVDCRGQEHDLSITWSITGGKRMISLDGREIQYSVGKRSNTARADIVEAAWRMADHVFELKCYAYKPKAGSPEKRNPKWKQYNLTIDGRSFFELPEIFDLGLRGLGTGRLPVTISSGSDWDQTTEIPTNKTVSSSSVSTQYTDQSSVKSSVQSRIEEQRRLLNKKKSGATTVKKGQPKNPNTSNAASVASSDLMSFRSLNVTDDQEEWNVFSSGVYSAEPSELREVRNRQNSVREQTNGARTVSNRTEHRQQSAPTSDQFSALVPQQQAQQPQKRYQPAQQPQNRCQPQTLPTMSDPSPTAVSDRLEKQNPPQSETPVQDMAAHIMLAPQQPPTYEEITQALVPSPLVPPQNEVQGHHQLQALPPSSSQLQIQPELQPAKNSSHYQPPLPSSDQRSAQPAGPYSHHQPQPTRSPQPASSSSYYQPEPANSSQPTGSSSHCRPQPFSSNQSCAEPAGASSHYQPQQPTNRSPHRPGVSSHYQPHPTNNYQPQPASSNQRSAEPQADSSQPTHNHQGNGKEQPVNKHHEDLPQQPIPGNLPKGANKFAFF